MEQGGVTLGTFHLATHVPHPPRSLEYQFGESLKDKYIFKTHLLQKEQNECGVRL